LIEGIDIDIALSAATPVICVVGLRKEVGRIASRVFGEPSRSLDVIAVTGTNGKTTVAQLCAHALKRIRGKAGYAGTLGLGPIDNLQRSENTTPDPISLQGLFSDLLEHGCNAVAIEVSSHAIVQSRVCGTALDVVVFTNVGHDHLDFHETQDAYIEAKKSLLRYEGIRYAVINIDDDVGRDLVVELNPAICCWTYSIHPERILRGEPRHLQLVRYIGGRKHSTLTVATPQGEIEITTGLIGDFNAQNLLAALGALMALGIDATTAAEALSRAPGVVGRMQLIESTSVDDPVVVVDYAHTPESLSRVLAALRPITTRNLVCLFGCGGDRDKTKRAPMGLAAEQGADAVIITSDNPRGESNADIATAILLGMREPDRVQVIHDRASAIKSVIESAGRGDVVLIAGKGHEARQEIAGVAHPFSDAGVAYQALREHSS
jgi:UDP-N-acetylmuramyl-tripeptide synthetase